MITVTEAKKLIEGNTFLSSAVSINLKAAAGKILAEDVISKIDVPPFNQSAMDGYAFQFNQEIREKYLKVIGEVQAGNIFTNSIGDSAAVRIFTGAYVPDETDTVVMQENVKRTGNEIIIEDQQLKKGLNIRLRGSQIKSGDTALKRGSRLTPGAIGFLASMGVTTVNIYATPAIGLIITGNELVEPGKPLAPGKIYESNSFTLTAALEEMNIHPATILYGKDEVKNLIESLNFAIERCDIVIVTGGISVGDYDLVKKSMDDCGVETVFHNVKQKPGKPLLFGKHGRKLLFGLPGNPAAVLTCFYEYIKPAINKMSGRILKTDAGIKKELASDFSKKEGLTYFLKGKLMGSEVMPLHGQESYQMGSFAEADCLIQLDEGKSFYCKGEIVEVHQLSKE